MLPSNEISFLFFNLVNGIFILEKMQISFMKYTKQAILEFGVLIYNINSKTSLLQVPSLCVHYFFLCDKD